MDRSSVLYQAMLTVGADGKNIMKLIPVPRRNGQPSPTQAAVQRSKGHSHLTPTSFPTQIPVRSNTMSHSTLTPVPIINAQFVPTQMPIQKTNGQTCPTQTPVQIINGHSPIQVAFQRTNEQSVQIIGPKSLPTQTPLSTSGQPRLIATPKKAFSVYKPLLPKASPQFTSRPVSSVNVSPSQIDSSHRDSLHEQSPQQQTVNPSAKVPQTGSPSVGCSVEPQVTAVSPAVHQSDVHKIIPKEQSQKNKLSNGRPDVKEPIFAPSACFSARESSPTVIFVSPGNTRHQEVTKTIGSAADRLRNLAEIMNKYNSNSNSGKTREFNCGLPPQAGVGPKLKLIPKLSKRPNSPIRWVIEDIDSCNDGHASIKPLSSESASSGNPASLNKTASERPWLTYDGRLFYVTKRGGSSFESPAATQSVPSSSQQSVFLTTVGKSPVTSADEVIDLCDDDGSPSSYMPENNPGDEDNVIFVSYVPPKTKSCSTGKEQLGVDGSNSRTDVLPARDGERIQNTSVSREECVVSPTEMDASESLTSKRLERNPDQQLVTMETDAETVDLANTNKEESSPTVQNSEQPAPDQTSSSASELCQTSDHQLRKIFGITADVKICLQRLDEAPHWRLPAQFPHTKSRVPVEGDGRLRINFKDKVDVKVLTELEQCASKENCCSGLENSFSPEAESVIGYVEPIDEDFTDENYIPQLQDTHVHPQTQKCGDINPSTRRVGRTRKRTMCLCCVPTILHPVIKSATSWEEVESWTSTIEGMSKGGGRTKASRKDGRTSTGIGYPSCKVHKTSASSGSSTDSDGLKRHEQIMRHSQHQAKKQHKLP
ncbi:ligand-dependent nuclear receptor-interacting factor 1 [Cyprinodon tularosa]|uniref:ligand-dependent nuclear receptor-interacting factor 1 n=1 Tax=Cyprinodon tularosa TaxID=77115 RepID=UPI0018E29147|nr:ligand-dependent nuclear receptor-interacting factor 1 [Cyprinodon tularosa]